MSPLRHRLDVLGPAAIAVGLTILGAWAAAQLFAAFFARLTF